MFTFSVSAIAYSRPVLMAEINLKKAPQAKPGTTRHPLGPMVYRVTAKRPAMARVIAALVLAGCLAILGVAAWLYPDPAGMGTHRQLGYPQCSLVTLVGLPCPTCGMTTAFAHTVRGELCRAFQAHPAGLVFALATVVTAAVSASALITAKVWAVNWYRVSPTWVALGVAAILVGGWVYKLAVGLMTGTLPLVR
ncbi:MAG: DUF2752 domain-containing protein [Phycisphaerales bacterium]|nr:MAG: DUF2752 domain-containing protein [Phycisphaerales bacterium]